MSEQKLKEIAGLQKPESSENVLLPLFFSDKCNAHLDIILMIFSPLPKAKLCDALNNPVL